MRKARRKIERMVFPIHHEQNHWIIAVVDVSKKSISIYDSWHSTWSANHKKKMENMAHYKYIVVRVISLLSAYICLATDSHLLQRLKLLVEKLASMRTVNIDPPIWGEWTIEPHRKVCSIFISLILS